MIRFILHRINMSRNIFQRMSSEIKSLKEENSSLKEKLRNFLENFDEETRNKFNVKGNNKVEQLSTENNLLTNRIIELEEEIKKLRMNMADLQDLNQELLTNIHSRENSFLT